VLHVIDGDTLCVALGATPDRWVALRLADAPRAPGSPTEAPQLRSVLMAVAFSENVSCRVTARDSTEGMAICELEGRSLVELMHDPSAIQLSAAWR
jgi:hypothetical protein